MEPSGHRTWPEQRGHQARLVVFQETGTSRTSRATSMLFLMLRALRHALVSGSGRLACEKEHPPCSMKDDGMNRLEVSKNKLPL